MARNYQEELALRNARASEKGLETYYNERKMKVRAKALGLDPNKRYPGLVPAEDAPRPKGLQGPNGPSPTPDWDYYWPTRTGRPQRKYTQMARYSRQYQCMEVVFRDGTPWNWSGVGEEMWVWFKRNAFERPTYDFLRGASAPVPNLLGKGNKGGWGTLVGEACFE